MALMLMGEIKKRGFHTKIHKNNGCAVGDSCGEERLELSERVKTGEAVLDTRY